MNSGKKKVNINGSISKNIVSVPILARNKTKGDILNTLVGRLSPKGYLGLFLILVKWKFLMELVGFNACNLKVLFHGFNKDNLGVDLGKWCSLLVQYRDDMGRSELGFFGKGEKLPPGIHFNPIPGLNIVKYILASCQMMIMIKDDVCKKLVYQVQSP